MKSLDMSGVMLYNTLRGAPKDCMCVFVCICVYGWTYSLYYGVNGTKRLSACGVTRRNPVPKILLVCQINLCHINLWAEGFLLRSAGKMFCYWSPPTVWIPLKMYPHPSLPTLCPFLPLVLTSACMLTHLIRLKCTQIDGIILMWIYSVGIWWSRINI